MRKPGCALTGLTFATFLATSPAAWAQDESSHHANDVCSAQNPSACLDGVGGGVTSLDSLRVTTTSRGTIAAESEERARLQARTAVSDGERGMAAGASMSGWSVWGSGGLSRYDSTVAIAPYEADSYNFLIGADRLFGDKFLAGFTIGVENTDTDTSFNGGGQDRTGINFSLYGAVLISDMFSVDGALGYGAAETDENRIDTGSNRAGGGATPGARIIGNYDSERAFGTINLNAVKAYGAWVVGARLGALHVVESQDAYTETGGTGRRSIASRHIDLTQAYASLDLGYSFKAFEPYALVGYRNDLSRDDGNSAGGLPAGIRTQPNDDDDWQGGLGVRYFGSNGVTGSLEWLRSFGREKFDEDNVSLTVRVPF